MAKRKMTKRVLLSELKKCSAVIAAKRDELRHLIEEASEIMSDCDDAADSLECAVESLSRNL